MTVTTAYGGRLLSIGPGVQYTDAPPAQKMERQSSSSSVQASSQVGYFAVVLGLVVLLVVVLVLYAFK